MAGRFRSRGPVFRFVKCFGKNFLENIFKKCIDFFPEIAYNEYNNKREVMSMKLAKLIMLLIGALIECGNKPVVFFDYGTDEETEFSAWGMWDGKIILFHNEDND